MHGFQELNSALVALTGSGIGATCYKIWSSISKKLAQDQAQREQEAATREKRLDKLEDNDQLQQAGIVAMLHHELYTICNLHIAAGHISTDDLDDLGYLFNSYHDLGGNGTGERLYKKVCELPIVN